MFNKKKKLYENRINATRKQSTKHIAVQVTEKRQARYNENLGSRIVVITFY